jgi:hypothetical protein
MGKVIYIGKTTNLLVRIEQYMSAFTFDDVRVIPCDVAKLDQYERRLIRLFKPRCNYHFNPNRVIDVDARRFRLRDRKTKRKNILNFKDISELRKQ